MHSICWWPLHVPEGTIDFDSDPGNKFYSKIWKLVEATPKVWVLASIGTCSSLNQNTAPRHAFKTCNIEESSCLIAQLYALDPQWYLAHP